MWRYTQFLLVLMFGIHLSSHAQSTAECDGVLIPTVEQSSNDRRMILAFVSVNAKTEYERLKKLDKDARAADATYKVFSAEYNDSRSREMFQEKTRNKLTELNFNLNESEARSYYRN
jgi:hypothetical protein